MKIVVIGAGFCGLASALALARSDHEVTVVERDATLPPADPFTATQWERPGIPHFLQPHAFLARGVKELRQNASDVYGSLLEAGAEELRLFEKMPDGHCIRRTTSSSSWDADARLSSGSYGIMWQRRPESHSDQLSPRWVSSGKTRALRSLEPSA